MVVPVVPSHLRRMPRWTAATPLAAAARSSAKHQARGSLAPLEHGGDPAAAEARYGRPAKNWLDLSTGINPHPYPVAELTAACWTRLPDGATYRALCRAAAGCYGVSDPDLVVPAPGAQALIQWLPRLRERSTVAVLGPAYAEHAHVWRTAGHRVEVVEGIDSVGPDANVMVVVNPNNPDGRRIRPDVLSERAGRLGERGGWMVVDEAFMDLAPDLSLAERTGLPGLAILRSFGKFFGLPGLRLGFALTEPELGGRLRQALGPWAVAGPAAAVGATALADRRWISRTRDLLAKEAARLDGLLAEHGLEVIGGTALFRLVETATAADLFDHLARRGILVRRFADQPRRLRFGLPPGEAAWDRLAAALEMSI